MGISRLVVCPVALLVICVTGCGSAESSSIRSSAATTTSVVQESDEPLPFARVAQPTPVPTSMPSAVSVSRNSAPVSQPAEHQRAEHNERESPIHTPDVIELKRWARNSPFYMFGDDVLAWNEQGQPLVRKVPVDHKAFADLRWQLGYQDSTIADTANTRLWLQECIRYYSHAAAGSSEAVQGAIAAQGLHDCLGGLAHFSQLLIRYWWSEAGLACISGASINWTLHGDDSPRPLAACASQGYDPAAPRPAGWLQQQCLSIVVAHPNPAYPNGPVEDASADEALPSCWAPLLQAVEAHGTSNAESGLPDSPHDCFHSLLGYVWARQTGLDSRPPNHPNVGCGYHAFEALR